MDNIDLPANQPGYYYAGSAFFQGLANAIAQLTGVTGLMPPIAPITAPEAKLPTIPPPIGGGSTDESWVSKDFLLYAALIAGGLVAAPVVYRAAMASSRGKRAATNDLIAQELGNASNRGVALLAALGPAIGFPIAYIGVQCLESRGIITRGLGNAVQTLMATAVAGQAASGIGSLVSGIAKAL